MFANKFSMHNFEMCNSVQMFSRPPTIHQPGSRWGHRINYRSPGLQYLVQGKGRYVRSNGCKSGPHKQRALVKLFRLCPQKDVEGGRSNVLQCAVHTFYNHLEKYHNDNHHHNHHCYAYTNITSTIIPGRVVTIDKTLRVTRTDESENSETYFTIF